MEVVEWTGVRGVCWAGHGHGHGFVAGIRAAQCGCEGVDGGVVSEFSRDGSDARNEMWDPAWTGVRRVRGEKSGNETRNGARVSCRGLQERLKSLGGVWGALLS